MRGKPVIQWALFLGLWAGLALPVVLVTRGGRTAGEAQHTDSHAVMTWVALRFSAQPSYFELLQHGETLWQEDEVDHLEYDHSFPVAMDEFGVEFRFQSELPSPGAIEITVEPDERRERSKTLWVDGAVDETLTFSWSGHD